MSVCLECIPSVWLFILSSYSFFFQAEDGIRDIGVTGVQTCALPISSVDVRATGVLPVRAPAGAVVPLLAVSRIEHPGWDRSEERRGGEECRSGWLPYH